MCVGAVPKRRQAGKPYRGALPAREEGMQQVHTPVMLQECLSYLVTPQMAAGHLCMCDSTLGEGGHTAAFLERYPNLTVTGIDRDKEQIKRSRELLAPYAERVVFCNAWFDDYYKGMKDRGEKTDVILFDLGISMFHYLLSGRGFSFQKDEALDMRLDSEGGRTAADIVNAEREEDLANIIYNYGGERLSRRIARAICQARRATKITSSSALADIVYNAVPAKYRHGRIHPATRTFQALRIAVNGELDRLVRALGYAFDCLEDGGRMGVISFHSLEDRITKQFMRSKAFPAEGDSCAVLVTRKGVKAAESEVASNPPSRSATLRVLERREGKAGDKGRRERDDEG